MTIDLKRFREVLSGAEAGELPEEEHPVLPYLLENLVNPLLKERRIKLGDLDYSAFDTDDLDDLSEYLESCDRISDKLSGINKFFCKAVPLAEVCRIGPVRRPFC